MTDIHALIEANRTGDTVGLPSFCTANAHVLRAILGCAGRVDAPIVIEATCNQVNQEGGYTGMTPADYMAWITELASEAGVSMDRLILGGDHLGPNPWRKETAESAMEKARELVRQYAEAGYRKIHLDASMALGGEPQPSFELVAERAAELCAVAEKHAPEPEALIYIIGTEVPIPGGETEDTDTLDVTSTERLEKTIETHRAAFAARGLEAVWPRIVSVVTQPGVDFSHTSIYPFDPAPAAPLRDAIKGVEGLSFEAHSTDYQSTEALAQLVANHFFFLKVGPELTFRFREAVFALAAIEAELGLSDPSRIIETLDACMAERPDHWQDYYQGSAQEIRLLKRYSYSDRIRYYWGDPQVAGALDKLLTNLRGARLSESLVSQYFSGFDFGTIPTSPDEMIARHVQGSVLRYFAACGFKAH
ncbi:D-tagatose-1,6-bisphosphate aldolase subunit GatZ/KbaZ [Limimaricola variabilis]|uniref:D-tagatose-1,6-bisphosphate aldolase subunit GatZ/KbaZ n=1 Tax=Limimaricola variabilis TaxID=1492771 RepID=A0ABR6HR62_9RHOB|nr:class II D-tagatose-bisphosphate aldolase, non-catalytic subunit [Limimaricola variabilis]MBB3713043.1 D-tagatose-1,6-bisphosphate aldolase subunit GatZ/KbaZ [Limimaricola variabilis]